MLLVKSAAELICYLRGLIYSLRQMSFFINVLPPADNSVRFNLLFSDILSPVCKAIPPFNE